MAFAGTVYHPHIKRAGLTIGPSGIGKSPGRDLALDAIRGIFIMILTVDHMYGCVVAVTWQTFGFVSVLSGFLFLSGYIVALAYGGSIRKHGVRTGLRKILRRIGQIYLWHVLSVVVVVGGSIILAWRGLEIDETLTSLHTLVSVALLQDLTVYFNIIPLYIFFLALGFVFLVLAFDAPALIALVGVTLWFCAEAIPPAFHPWGDSALLKPLHWQAVFTLGLAFGLFHLQGRRLSVPRWLYWVAGVLALWFFALRWSLIDLGDAALLDALFNRDRLAPGRLLNILCLLLLFSLILPHLKPWLARRTVLVRIGQNSLIAFSLQIMIVYYLSIIRNHWAFFDPVTIHATLFRDPHAIPALVYLLAFDLLSLALVAGSTLLVVRLLKQRTALGWRPKITAPSTGR